MSQKIANLTFNDISDEFNIHFELHDAHPSLANAIRRMILSDVETIGFRTEPLENSEINIIKNTSSLHNEFLLHRIGMIPVNYDDVDNYNPDRYRYIINVTNDTSQIKEVTTKDFQVIDTEMNDGEGGIVNSEDFFPKNQETGEYILITKLKPNLEGMGETIHLEGKAIKSSGSENARWQPTSCVVYSNKIDQTKAKKALEEFLEKKKIEYADTFADNREKLENEFNISEIERYYITDDRDTPSVFNFNIESVGILKSHIILLRSLTLLNYKLIKLNKNLNLIKTKSNTTELSFTQSDTVMKGFDLNIPNENHTLGFLIQTYIEKYFDKSQVTFIGYFNPHPLKDNIVIRISTIENNKDIAIDVILKCISMIQKDIQNLKKQTSQKFGIEKKTFTVKRK